MYHAEGRFIYMYDDDSTAGNLWYFESSYHSDISICYVIYGYLQKNEQELKTMTLLRDSDHYAKDQALVLCQMHKFKSGILYLYEQGKL